MRIPPWSPLIVCLSLLVPAFARPAPQEAEKPNPLRGFNERNRSSLAGQLEGLWLLMDFEDPESQGNMEEVTGFAMFSKEGFLAIHMQGTTVASSFFGERPEFWAQSELQRYRIDGFGRLQTAAMFGFNNLNEDGEIDPFPAEAAREHDVLVNDGVLEMRHSDGIVLRFAKTSEGEFPIEAIRYLDGLRAGELDYPEEDTGGFENR